MNIKETQRILASITAVYPSFTKDRDCRILTQVWQQVFADVPYPDVSKALGAFFASDTKGFPPTPGAVNAYIRKIRQLNEPTENDAWARVVKAASRGLRSDSCSTTVLCAPASGSRAPRRGFPARR